MLFDVKSTNHLIFHPPKKVVLLPLLRSQWIYQKFWVNRFFIIVIEHGLFHIPKLWKTVLGFGWFSFLFFVKQHPRWGVCTVFNEEACQNH
jgi:hypothetical protein